jgi:hypothetical protein
MGETVNYDTSNARPRRKHKRAVWVTKDKREIAIARLEDDHLVNVILMLVHFGDRFRAHVSLDALMHASCFQGEMAQMAVEHEACSILEQDPLLVLLHHHDAFPMLLAEARMRRLTPELKAKLAPVIDALLEHFAEAVWCDR